MNSTPARSRLLFTELICNLALFALCAVVCACLLLQSWSISRNSAQLTQAVSLAQDIAESWRAGSVLPTLSELEQTSFSVHCTDQGRALSIEIYTRDEQRLIYRLEEVRSFA